MSNAVIEHKGVVVESLKNMVRVRINAESACASCHAKGACSASDMEEKIIDVPTESDSYVKGDAVSLSMKPSAGFTALFYAYMLPFIILMITLVVSLSFYNELFAGLLSLAVLVPYYTVLYFKQGAFTNKFSYLLKKL